MLENSSNYKSAKCNLTKQETLIINKVDLLLFETLIIDDPTVSNMSDNLSKWVACVSYSQINIVL